MAISCLLRFGILSWPDWTPPTLSCIAGTFTGPGTEGSNVSTWEGTCRDAWNAWNIRLKKHMECTWYPLSPRSLKVFDDRGEHRWTLPQFSSSLNRRLWSAFWHLCCGRQGVTACTALLSEDIMMALNPWNPLRLWLWVDGIRGITGITSQFQQRSGNLGFRAVRIQAHVNTCLALDILAKALQGLSSGMCQGVYFSLRSSYVVDTRVPQNWASLMEKMEK